MPKLSIAHYLFNTCRSQSELRFPVDLTGAVKCKKKQKSIAMGPKYLVACAPSKLVPPVLGPEVSFLQFKEPGPYKMIENCMRIREGSMHNSVDPHPLFYVQYL
jgi:hypothetical protein